MINTLFSQAISTAHFMKSKIMLNLNLGNSNRDGPYQSKGFAPMDELWCFGKSGGARLAFFVLLIHLAPMFFFSNSVN